MSGLTFTLFDYPNLSRNGVPLRLRSRKCIALLAYLAVTDANHSRTELESIFWPDSNREGAHNVLRVTLSILRRAMGEAWLVVDRETIGLDGSHRAAVDVIRFRDLLAQCRTHDHPTSTTCPQCLPLLVEAVELCQGDFMSGFSLRDSPQFDDWQALETEALREELGGVLERLVEGFAVPGDVQRAIGYAKQWVTLDPLREPAHRHLMRLYMRSDQQAAALQQYETCERNLREELGVSPSRETFDLYQAIRARQVSGPGHSLSPLSVAPVPPPHTLPPQPTPFVGREEELAQITQLLVNPTCRLLTVVGPGGIGKTRLAIQVGTDQEDRFIHGVYFVPLSSLGSTALFASTIMETLNVSRQGGIEPNEQLLNHLQDKNILLILDNFEHLLEGTGLVAQMLAEAPRLKLLITSRERLNLREEWLFELWGMESPGDREIAKAEEVDSITGRQDANLEDAISSLQDYSAIQLFVQSARRVRRDFSLVKAGAGLCGPDLPLGGGYAPGD